MRCPRDTKYAPADPERHLRLSRTALSRSALLLLSCAIVALVVFGKLPGDSVFWRTLQNFAHYPAFVAIAIMLIALSRPRVPQSDRPWIPYAATLVACLLLGAVIEFAQSLTGGDVSADDVFRDLAGAAIGLSWHALRGSFRGGPRWNAGQWLIVLASTAASLATLSPVAWMLAAYTHRNLEFPTLVSGQSHLDLFFLDTGERQRVIEPLPGTLAQRPDDRGIRVTLRAGSESVFLTEPVADWSAYHTLALDVANPTDRPETLRLRVHDQKHNHEVDDRFNQSFLLPPHARGIWRFALAKVRSAPATRRMRLDEIAGVGLFDPQPQADTVFYLNRMWLERLPPGRAALQ